MKYDWIQKVAASFNFIHELLFDGCAEDETKKYVCSGAGIADQIILSGFSVFRRESW